MREEISMATLDRPVGYRADHWRRQDKTRGKFRNRFNNQCSVPGAIVDKNNTVYQKEAVAQNLDSFRPNDD